MELVIMYKFCDFRHSALDAESRNVQQVAGLLNLTQHRNDG